jgi:hypothetical protein
MLSHFVSVWISGSHFSFIIFVHAYTQVRIGWVPSTKSSRRPENLANETLLLIILEIMSFTLSVVLSFIFGFIYVSVLVELLLHWLISINLDLQISLFIVVHYRSYIFRSQTSFYKSRFKSIYE